MFLSNQTLCSLVEIAADLEPEYSDWHYPPDHTWCLDATEEAEQLCLDSGMAFCTRNNFCSMDLFCGRFHVWLEMQSGEIIDLTVKQFFLPQGRGTSPLLAGQQHDFWILGKGDPRRKMYRRLGEDILV